MVIDEWMNKEGESACWEYLCRDVLRSEGVGLGHVADRIEQVIKECSLEYNWWCKMLGLFSLLQELGLESSRQVSSQAGGSGGGHYMYQ